MEYILPQPMMELADRLRNQPLTRQIRRLQMFFERYQYRKERKISTPAEFHRSGFGDCKAFAVAKYAVCRQAGIDDERLGLLSLRLENKSYHMVLQIDDIILDRIRFHYSIPRVPQCSPMFGWNESKIWGYFDVGDTLFRRSWNRIELSNGPVSLSCLKFLTLANLLLRQWRDVKRRMALEVSQGVYQSVQDVVLPSNFERIALSRRQHVDLRDISQATERELMVLIMKSGGKLTEKLLDRLSGRARAELNRYVERNRELLIDIYRQLMEIPQ